MAKILTWRKFHRRAGVITALFFLIFCISGIILNHRGLFSGCDVSRSLMPRDYRLTDYNNGIIKGTTPLSGDSLLAYGNAGIWLTDNHFSEFTDYNNGLPSGIDRRNIRNIARLKDGSLWCASQFGIYNFNGKKWTEIKIDDNERIADITPNPDSTSVVILTRSKIYEYDRMEERLSGHILLPLDGKTRKVTLFKTFWMLHSGELFGTTGRIIVDMVAVIIIILCLTGIVLFVMPYRIRWISRHSVSRGHDNSGKIFRLNYRLHDKTGYYTAILTLIIAFTGMCLRPPMMIPLVLTSTPPVPFTTQDSDNHWHDKLRGIRWDDNSSKWLLSTSDGFISVNPDFLGTPEIPSGGDIVPVSPMGITVFEKTSADGWLVGSFSGLYLWYPHTGRILDYLTGKPFDSDKKSHGPVSTLISGASSDIGGNDLVIFDYTEGNRNLPAMPRMMQEQPMSLWNVALELHVGRCYTPFLGPFSQLFVFLFGLFLVLILSSGLIIRIKHKHHKHHKQTEK